MPCNRAGIKHVHNHGEQRITIFINQYERINIVVFISTTILWTIWGLSITMQLEELFVIIETGSQVFCDIEKVYIQ
jgi:hypothetical protein